jgi:hypothetical protein
LTTRARAARLCGALAAAALLLGTLAAAQRVDPKRPTTLKVGPTRGASPTARVDGRRTGMARSPLPTGTLRIAWQRTTGASLEGPPLVDARGDILLGTGRGDVIALDPEDGLERPHGGVLGAAPLGAMALLADRTVVFVTAGGDALGSRDGVLRFRTRVGDGRLVTERSGALALDDGGVAVACGTELATLDAEGHVRARASLDEPVALPLVAAPGKIAAITATGRVFLWAPGREPVRAGSFGGVVDGGAVLTDDHTLVAIVGGQQLIELDLERGVAAARMGSPGVLFGPPAFRGDTAYLLGGVPGRTFGLAVDGSGQETMRVALVTTPVAPLADGGAGTLSVPPHTGPLVDAAGTLAFGTPEGRVGVLTKDGALELLGDPICLRAAGLGTRGPTPPPPTAAYAGLAPAGPNAFVVACETGVVLMVTAAHAGE